jgi:hypothetical protein
MKGHGIAPDIKIYLGLIRACARHGDVASAIKVRTLAKCGCCLTGWAGHINLTLSDALGFSGWCR